MIDVRLLAWHMMPPTAFASLFTLLVYFIFRIYCLGCAQQESNAEITNTEIGSRATPASLGLAWFFLVLELLMICMFFFGESLLPVTSQCRS